MDKWLGQFRPTHTSWSNWTEISTLPAPSLIAAGALSLFIAYKLIRWNTRRSHTFCMSGKVVVITGAAGGLGQELVAAFISRGAKVVLTGRHADKLRNVELNLQTTGGSTNDTAVVELDMEDIASVVPKARTILDAFGTVDVLVLNAGVSSRGTVKETGFDVDQKMMLTNFLGPVALTKALLPTLLSRDSCIVAVSSVQGRMAIPFRSSYAASKHALQAFFDSFRAELIGKPPNILVVSPGYIRTSLSLNALGPDGKPYGKMDETTAAGMDPKTVAQMIVCGVEERKSELVICGVVPKLGIILRAVLPSLYMKLMRKRAEKSLN